MTATTHCPQHAGGSGRLAFRERRLPVGRKTFATLALEKEGYGVLLLAPEQQAGMVEDEPPEYLFAGIRRMGP